MMLKRIGRQSGGSVILGTHEYFMHLKCAAQRCCRITVLLDSGVLLCAPCLIFRTKKGRVSEELHNIVFDAARRDREYGVRSFGSAQLAACCWSCVQELPNENAS